MSAPTCLADSEKLKTRHWLKRPKAVSKNEIWTKIWMIQNLIFEILVWKYYFGHKMFLYSSTHSSGHHLKFFLIFRFSSRKSQSLTKVSKKITHLTTRFRSKNLTHFKTSTAVTQTKTFMTLQIFQQICFCLVSGKTLVLHHFLTPKNCMLEAL